MVVVECKAKFSLQLGPVLIMRQDKDIKAGVSSWKMASVGALLHDHFERLKSIDGHSICASQENEELLLFLQFDRVQNAP